MPLTRAGNLFVSAPTVTVDGGIIQALTTADGNAGDITLEVGSLNLTGGAEISSSSGGTNLRTGQRQVGRGQAGNVTITATEGITIAGRDSFGFHSGIFTSTYGSGNAGHLSISTPHLHMQDGRITSATHGDGRAGDLTIEVGSLTMTGGAQIASASGVQQDDGTVLVGTGQGGNLTIIARDVIAISGRDSEGIPSTISATTFGSGNAGSIFISTSTLRVEGVRGIQAGTSGSGRAGDIEVRVGSLSLTGGASIDTGTAGTGPGGNLRITATDLISISGRDSEGIPSSITSGTSDVERGGDIELQAKRIELRDGGTISANSTSGGAAGTIQIQAGETFHSQHGSVTTHAAQAGWGTIVLRAGRLVQLQESEVTTSVRGGGGDAGNLTLTAPFVVAEGSQIVANAFGGQGGNIRIEGGVVLIDPASLVSASSTLGVQGTVDIRAPVTNLTGVVAPLPERFVAEAGLLRDRCAARLREGRVSSLVERGRDGVPATPEGVLPSRPPQARPEVASAGEAARRGRGPARASRGGHRREGTEVQAGRRGATQNPMHLDLECAGR
jgi:large exoprotein involved in heme utilization and adhesion